MSRKKGLLAEDLACIYLKNMSYEIVGRNFCCRFGEIDVIAFKEGVLHFIEVKQRRMGDPALTITPVKLEKLSKSIGIYFQKHPQHVPYPYCLDALLIYGSLQNHTIEWIENLSALS
ncbi:YraN family protein [Helicobacter cynogastricus]|uniref:YraN family protein n=1 Tax=Helicobacter cynogastricus TaxID=329937 RepID=UPI000CF103BC|nr:YraN family protein [Helicobacter cynogastricus]